MEKNLEAVKRLAKDLRKGEPRPASEPLGGFELAARCIDKCRATLVGWQGDYMYGCPMDRQFLTAAGIGAEELKYYVATGATDEQIAAWIEEHAHATK